MPDTAHGDRGCREVAHVCSVRTVPGTADGFDWLRVGGACRGWACLWAVVGERRPQRARLPWWCLAGGLSLATLAAARAPLRRSRYVESSSTSDLSVALFHEDARTPADLLALRIRSSSGGADPGVFVTALRSDSIRCTRWSRRTSLGDTPRFRDRDAVIRDGRVTVIDGRLADPDRVDEVVVNEAAAAFYEIPLGSRRVLATIEGGEEVVDATTADILDTTLVQVVGIVRFVEEVLRDEYDVTGLLLATPAMTKQYLARGFAYRFHALHLDANTEPSAVVAAYENLAGDDFGLIVRRTASSGRRAARASPPV